MDHLARLELLPKRQQRGSRARCIILTDGPRELVAKHLTDLVAPHAKIESTDVWMPRGFDAPAEAKLGEAAGLLSVAQRQILTDWWLAEPVGANTPNWDIAATATIDGRRGLVLVEAKAHRNEIKSVGKGVGNTENDGQIERAITEASRNLAAVMPGFNLSAATAYQLANRFAWAWKIASLGIPIALVYLGFLKADEMRDQGEPFADAEAWASVMKAHSETIVPLLAWQQPLEIGGTSLRALVRSTLVPLHPV
jgi:hypothetical protein